MTEADFITRLKQGDFSAFEELLRQSGDQVFNTALSFVQNRHDAEDISQEVFIEVYQSIRRFNEQSKLSTWIYRIAVSKSLEFLRRKKAKKRLGFVQGLFGKEHTLNKSDDSIFYHPGVQLENKERTAILFQAVGQLPENQRTAFLLNKVEGLSYAEVAEIMKLSLSSVESLMVRARRNLQGLLADYYHKNEK